MKASFTEEQIKQGLNQIEIEEDQVLLYGQTLEGSDKHYILTGIAEIDGERYHDFQVEFQLIDLPESEDLETILAMDWDWYDYLCLHKKSSTSAKHSNFMTLPIS